MNATGTQDASGPSERSGTFHISPRAGSKTRARRKYSEQGRGIGRAPGGILQIDPRTN